MQLVESQQDFTVALRVEGVVETYMHIVAKCYGYMSLDTHISVFNIH